MAPLALLVLAALSLVSAAPLEPRANGQAFVSCPAQPSNTGVPTACNSNDAPYDVAENALYSNIDCQGIAPNAVSKPWLLVPGTGATGPEAFQQGSL